MLKNDKLNMPLNEFIDGRELTPEDKAKLEKVIEDAIAHGCYADVFIPPSKN